MSMTVTPLKEAPMTPREDMLFTAVTQAVAIINESPNFVAESAGYQVSLLLRTVLWEYAEHAAAELRADAKQCTP